MTRKHASAGYAIGTGILDFVSMLRRFGMSCVQKYANATQLVLLLLFVYVLLSAPIVIAWIVGVRP
jgi:hypothetical protein